ncbi:MAG: putative lipid II flippase FtsW [Candidatus Omnitrophica bacterium]|nr:putative lipid II flippase FtsW [Candidatus Omnitrophota bacterium]MBU1924655.1 putative lipid II flippase FtsW [Candidatus Omnitrophota bacterium]
MDFRQTRINLAAVVFILICVGIVMIYSASAIYAYENLGDSAYYLKRHLFYVFVGLLFGFLAMNIEYERLRKIAKPLLIISAVLLLILLVPGIGRAVGGARRWFRIGAFSFQPSEFAKFAIILYLADFLARKRSCLHSFVIGFFPALAVLGVIAGLILIQPDLGTVLAIFAVGFIMFFIAGIKITHMVSVFLSTLPILYVLIFSVPYRRNRILSFLNPWSDPQGTGFQIIQSLVALGSGGLCGAGLGQGKQKLLYLPASYTDFIFSIIGEELGFLGTTAIIILFVVFLIQATKISLKANDFFGQILSFGLISCLVIEAIVNMGVTTSLFPTKGLPFPFISYGGTSLIFNMVYVGIILNIGKNNKQ